MHIENKNYNSNYLELHVFEFFKCCKLHCTVTITDNSFSSIKWLITTTSVTKLEAVLPCLGEGGCFSAGLSSQCGVKLLTTGWDPL